MRCWVSAAAWSAPSWTSGAPSSRAVTSVSPRTRAAADAARLCMLTHGSLRRFFARRTVVRGLPAGRPAERFAISSGAHLAWVNAHTQELAPGSIWVRVSWGVRALLSARHGCFGAIRPNRAERRGPGLSSGPSGFLEARCETRSSPKNIGRKDWHRYDPFQRDRCVTSAPATGRRKRRRPLSAGRWHVLCSASAKHMGKRRDLAVFVCIVVELQLQVGVRPV